MRPIAELDAALAKKIVGVIFDIDDTVTREGRLELVAFEAMWRWRKAGLFAIAATGRPLGLADVVAQHWPVDAAIGENGAGWVWRTKEGHLRDGYFANAADRAAERAILARIVERVSQELPTLRLSRDSHARRCDVAWDTGEEAHESEETIDKLVRIIASEGAKSSVSSVHAHAFITECDKAQGAIAAAKDALARDIRVEMDAWLFIGDSGNDSAAFARFSTSAGVANIREHLTRIATPPCFVSQSDRGVGFAEILDLVLSKRASG